MLIKSDLKAMKQLIDGSINSALKNRPTNNDLIGLARGTEIDKLKLNFLDKLEKWKNEIINKIDPVLGRVKTAEEENIVLRAREDSRQEERQVLEGRIKKLEFIHPNNRHIEP